MMILSNSDNPLIGLIKDGRIKQEKDLKKAWRRLARQTHPDLSGRVDDSSSDEFHRITDWYEEAREFLSRKGLSTVDVDWEREFFLCLKELEDLELPFNKTKTNKSRHEELEKKLFRYLDEWLGNEADTYQKGLEEYKTLKADSRINDQEHIYRSGFYGLVKPLLYNINSYKLTGKSLYLRQFRKILKTVEAEKDAQKYPNLFRLLQRLNPKDT